MFSAAALFLVSAPLQAQTWQESTLQFNNLPKIDAIDLRSQFHGYQSAVDRDYTEGHLAYDYSVNVIKDQAADLYRLYSGGRWRSDLGDGDHVLQHTSATGAGGMWSMPHPERPEWYQGDETGQSGQWFSRNVLEPEVVKVDGVYYMYTQVMILAGDPIDIPGQVAEAWADRIELHVSADGDNWTRFEQRGVIINLDEPTRTALHHQEVIHVPWDDKPFWMYVAAHVNDTFVGYHRIRSDDPTTFDASQAQVASLAQLGNQIGYLKQAPGGPLFVRITFTGNGDPADPRDVPTLQFSRDGLAWFWGDGGPVLLDGSKDNDANRNCYFLGLSSLDGTGEIEYLGDHTYRAVYAATTSNSPVTPEIWHSEIGVGELTFTIVPHLLGDLNDDGFVAQTDLDIVLGEWGNRPPVNPRADPDGNGLVAQGDLDVVLSEWGQGTPPTPVPGPGTMSLLASAGLAFIRRRR